VTEAQPDTQALLEVRDLQVHIPIRHGLHRGTVQAVDGVSFTLERGRTLGLVGESGCGKSTTARATMRLQEPTGGQVFLNGQDITAVHGPELRRLRRHMQIVFQDPYSALNPRMTVGQIVAEPMRAQGMSKHEIGARVEQLLETVGLQRRHQQAFPHQFSGGQRQRIGTARALSTHPDLLVLDEPVSALDVSVQAQMLNLFTDLQRDLNIGMIFISHDLTVVRHLSDQVAVMYLGRIVETGDADQVLEQPLHPYTEALISAAPGGTAQRERITLTGEVPSAIDPPSGCRFRTRCWKATEQCRQDPPLVLPAGGDHPVACWHPNERHLATTAGPPAG
jgi:oligopeptide/dipeptide ABC transporter ATP-binding protein